MINWEEFGGEILVGRSAQPMKHENAQNPENSSESAKVAHKRVFALLRPEIRS